MREYTEDEGLERLYSAVERMKFLQDSQEKAREENGLPDKEGVLTYREIWQSLFDERIIDAPAQGDQIKDLLVEEYGVLEEVDPSEAAKQAAADERRIATRYQVTDDYDEKLEEIEWEEVRGTLGRD